MRKFQTVVIGASLMMLAACGEKAPSGNETVATAPAPKVDTAEDVIGLFTTAGLKVENVVNLTAESDSNQLLGRPGQYTSKAFFYDARHPKQPEGDEGEHTVEVFASAEDAKRRHDYIKSMTENMPMLAQYQVLRGPVLVRFDKAMLPAQVDEYKKVIEGAVSE